MTFQPIILLAKLVINISLHGLVKKHLIPIIGTCYMPNKTGW